MKLKQVLDKEWIYLVSRPRNLFIASVVLNDFNYKYMHHFGQFINSILSVQIKQNKGGYNFFLKEEYEKLDSHRDYLINNDLNLINKLFDEGILVNSQYKNHLSGKQKLKFNNLTEVLDFFHKLHGYGLLYPYFIGDNIKDAKILKQAQKLRSVSYVQDFIVNFVVPETKNYLKENKLDEDLIDYITERELIKNDFSLAKSRKENYSDNKYNYILYSDKYKDYVFYSMNPADIVNNLAPKLDLFTQSSNVITGMVGYKGIVKGNAVVIQDYYNIPPNIGSQDIIISVNANPSLLKAWGKAAGMVTDEGGVVSHGAILAREMKKPCILGTKNATTVIKNGDYIELDADEGVVKILKK